MSVYTHLSSEEISQFLSRYPLGELQSVHAISDGVENTNYLLKIKKQNTTTAYIFTLFEYLPINTLPFFIELQSGLAKNNILVPKPILDNNQEALHEIKNKPCLISSFLQGHHLDQPSTINCQQLGVALANIHITGSKLPLYQKNQRGIHWIAQQTQRLKTLLPNQDSQYMQTTKEKIMHELTLYSDLPTGLIHGDLFPDNVLFSNDEVTGIIDFYNACHDFLLYDLAVTVNAWTIETDLSFNTKKYQALIDGYTSIRKLTATEKKAWPLMLKLATLRFWISRLITFAHPENNITQNDIVRPYKDPDIFKHMLYKRMNNDIPNIN